MNVIEAQVSRGVPVGLSRLHCKSVMNVIEAQVSCGVPAGLSRLHCKSVMNVIEAQVSRGYMQVSLGYTVHQ